jgi:ring-1,2-phenylacetyl-CoA epoxidase subunit PaaC
MSDIREALFVYTQRLGDNCLILGQRLGEWVGHTPVLEEDIATANVALDLIGQAQLWLGLAGEIEGAGRSADTLAYFRDSGAFRNLLLVEQPNGDFAQTLMRQFLFDAWHKAMLDALAAGTDDRVAAIAGKAAKEVAYHRTRSTDLVISLGDGTEESHARMQRALDDLRPYTGELTTADAVDDTLMAAGIAPDLTEIAAAWERHVSASLSEARLVRPDPVYMQSGGKQGLHGEALGYLIAEMQVLQRSHPGGVW